MYTIGGDLDMSYRGVTVICMEGGVSEEIISNPCYRGRKG